MRRPFLIQEKIAGHIWPERGLTDALGRRGFGLTLGLNGCQAPKQPCQRERI